MYDAEIETFCTYTWWIDMPNKFYSAETQGLFFHVHMLSRTNSLNVRSVYWISAMEYIRHFGAYKIVSLKQLLLKMLNIKVGEMAYE